MKKRKYIFIFIFIVRYNKNILYVIRNILYIFTTRN